MESIKKAKDRLSKYPILVAKCSTAASVYAKCVTEDFNKVKKHACDKEFQDFKKCLMEQAKNMKTRL
jgi:hypothetical protein